MSRRIHIRARAACARAAGRAGLTLVEVMLAVAILSVGLTALLTAASRCIAVMKQAKNYQNAQWTLGLGEVDHPIERTNDVTVLEVAPVEYPNGLTFSREVEPLDEDTEEGQVGLYIVRTRVTWSQHGKDSYEEAVSYVLQTD